MALSVALVLLSACGGSSSKNNNTAVSTEEPNAATVAATTTAVATPAAAATTSGSAASAATGTAASRASPAAAAGKTVQAGDLDITITAVRAVKTKQYDGTNDADTAVDIVLADSRADSASFSSAFDVKLIDDKGTAHKADPFCTKCPDQLDDANLKKGDQAKGTIYFGLRGAEAKEIDYQRFDGPLVKIPITETGFVAVQAGPTPDPNSAECKYAQSLVAPILALAFSGLSEDSLATPGPSGTVTPAQLQKAVNAQLTAANAAVAALKQITPPAEYKDYNADVLKVFTGIQQQLQDAQKAAAAGDFKKANDLLTAANNGMSDSANQDLDQKYAALSDRIQACLNN